MGRSSASRIRFKRNLQIAMFSEFDTVMAGAYGNAAPSSIREFTRFATFAVGVP